MKHKITAFFIAIGLCISCHADDGITVLTVDEYESAVKSDTNAVVLDVRRLSEYEEAHIKNAVLLDYLDADVFTAGIGKLDKSKTYYIYCRSGRRSHNAALKMKENGFKVFDMKGGFLEWKTAGKPVCKSELSYNKNAMKFSYDSFKEKMKEPWLGNLLRNAISR